MVNVSVSSSLAKQLATTHSSAAWRWCYVLEHHFSPILANSMYGVLGQPLLI